MRRFVQRLREKETKHPQMCSRKWKRSRKRCYGSIEEATAAMQRTREANPGREFQVFLCKFCGAWHIGGVKEAG